MITIDKIEIWGGIEGTINRVGSEYFDQSEYSGHYHREQDIELIASLGIKMLRYPVLWEKHQPQKDTAIDWSFVEKNLTRLKQLNVEPIAGLVHHGSGPSFVNFFDGSFEEGVANYARMVAKKFPWLQYYTPINEPLTTARFCGLYGHWYPHAADDFSFYTILLSECKAVVMAMKAIREINPDAKLIQTEDLSKAYSTPVLQYQADLENHRRWLSYDLLCGRVNAEHPMWNYLVKLNIDETNLGYFLQNQCTPDICGFNYYITSERYLDDDLSKYPEQYHGGNGRHRYADIETVLVPIKEKTGPAVLLKEAYAHLQLPIAVTECHLHSTREEQMRWFNEMWETVNELKEDGVDIRALTAWAIFGLHGWNKLVTEPWGTYEPGVFNVSTGSPRPTALARLIRVLTKHKVYYHPVLETEGWWKRDSRVRYPASNVVSMKSRKPPKCQPLLIFGKSGTLGTAFGNICAARNLHHILLSRAEADITDKETVEQLIQELNPWAIINAAGYVNIDHAEKAAGKCMAGNCKGPTILAEACAKSPVKLMTFSSDLVFDGTKDTPYVESDPVNPLNVYGQSKAAAEKNILERNPNALIIRSGNFFGPWDKFNFITSTLVDLKEHRKLTVADDVYVSATYVPDLVNESLDLLLDNEHGIFHITNDGKTSWAQLAVKVAEMAGCDKALIDGSPIDKLQLKAKRPLYSVLGSEKGIRLPKLEDALIKYFEELDNVYQSGAIAV